MLPLFLLLSLAPSVAPQFFQDHFYSMDGPSNNNFDQFSANFQRINGQVENLMSRVKTLEKKVATLQISAHSDWNKTEIDGSMYKLFEQRKSWDEAESFCQSQDAHLAVVDSARKNEFINGLINESATADFVWIGMKTKTSTTSERDSFSNFAPDSPIDGCAVMDVKGAWSIRSCVQLRPFVCHLVISLQQ